MFFRYIFNVTPASLIVKFHSQALFSNYHLYACLLSPHPPFHFPHVAKLVFLKFKSDPVLPMIKSLEGPLMNLTNPLSLVLFAFPASAAPLTPPQVPRACHGVAFLGIHLCFAWDALLPSSPPLYLVVLMLQFFIYYSH